MTPPIFIFTDDLDVWASVDDAERYYEPQIIDALLRPIAAYDREGNVFEVKVGHAKGFDVKITPADPPRNERESFIETLRDKLIGWAEERPDLLEEAWVRGASGEDLIEWCIATILRPRTRRGRGGG